MVMDRVLNFVSKTSFNVIPDEVVTIAKKALLDFVAVAYAGYESKAAHITLRSAKWLNGEQKVCTIIGNHHKHSPLAAIFVNATLASSMDFDDGHRDAVGHPGSMIIPALFAASEMDENCTGKDFLTSMVVGYEIAIRCGIVMNSSYNHLFYGSGGWAHFGSAASVAKIRNLTSHQLHHAITIGEVYGPTAQCGKSIDAGAMTKESIGWGATTAFMGVMLAENEFTGPDNILLDNHLYNIDIDKIFSTIGSTYEMAQIYFKQYPSCKWSHSPIDAALQIKENDLHTTPIEEIDEITIETFSKALTLAHIAPKTTEAAQYSIPFTVATALYYGKFLPAHVSENSLHNKDILSLAQKVKLQKADDLELIYPEKRPARLILKLKNGQTFQREVYVIKGDPEYPLSWEDLIEKFHLCTQSYLDKGKRKVIIDKIMHLEEIDDIKDVIHLFQPAH